MASCELEYCLEREMFLKKRLILLCMCKSKIQKQKVKHVFKTCFYFFLWTCFYGGCSSDIASSYFFRPSKVTEHVTSRVSGGEFRIK